MEKSSNYGETRIVGSCYNFQFFTAKHGFWISVSAEVGIQGAGVWKQLHNNLQTKNFSIYLSISFREKICDIRLFLPFLCFPIDVMIDFSDRLHNPFPKFRMKAKFLLHFYSSSYFYQWLLKHFVFFFFNFSDLSEWEPFPAVSIILKTQLQHIGAGKLSFVANHIFPMCKTAMQWHLLRKNTIWFFIAWCLKNSNPVLLSSVKL